MKYLKYTGLLLVMIFWLAPNTGHAQTSVRMQWLYANDSLSFRGLSVPQDSVVWVSGSRGTVGKSVNGGRTWQWMRVPGYEQRDFRDIEAFDAHTAVIMAVAEPAHILRTTDGGNTWHLVFADSTAGMFLDAMHFRDQHTGIVVGDPIDGRFFIRGTRDGGQHWDVTYPAPPAGEGEACFAASGTNIHLQKNGSYVLVTGGTVSRIIRNGSVTVLPLVQGKESTGANSLAVWKRKRLAVVGGDFTNDRDTTGNAAFSRDGGNSWQQPSAAPRGYRSCVIFLDMRTLLSCGTSGVDISPDGGRHWQALSAESFHVCQAARNGKTVYLAGANGRIARLERTADK
jgi:photosystem II stability/assembly factor-like uncharacterized protein